MQGLVLIGSVVGVTPTERDFTKGTGPKTHILVFDVYCQPLGAVVKVEVRDCTEPLPEHPQVGQSCAYVPKSVREWKGTLTLGGGSFFDAQQRETLARAIVGQAPRASAAAAA